MSSTPLPPISGPPSYRQTVQPLPATNSPARSSRWLAGILVWTLAVLLASFPVRHSDIWYRLAAGRDLLHGQWNLGTYPPSIRSTWLFNAGLYAIDWLLGEGGLVGLKAMLVGLTAVRMFQLARRRGGLWLPTVVVALALLAMSQRLPLQPLTLSCFFLVLTAGWIFSESQAGLRGRTRFRLPILFLIWAQCDPRVVLGFAAVLLTKIGERLDARRVRDREAATISDATGPGGLGWRQVGVLAVVSCLNPLVLQAVAGGEGIGWLFGEGEQRLVASPFDSLYFAGPGRYPAGWAYHLLLVAGVGRFIFSWFAGRVLWRDWLAWLGLTGGSVLEVTWVPLWAAWSGLVLGPQAMAWLAERLPSGPAWDWRPLRAVAFCWMLGWIVCAWPGWLQGPPFEPRRWGFDLPQAAEQMAQLLADWQARGRLSPDAVGVHLQAETAAAVAWFAPTVRAVWDRSLRERLANADTPSDEQDAWQRAAPRGYLVVSDNDRTRLLVILERLLGDPKRWTLWTVVGDIALVGWGDGSAGGAGGLAWDMETEAFANASPLPSMERPAISEPLGRWWRAFTTPAVTRTADRDAAVMNLLLAEVFRRQAPVRHLTAWEASELAGWVGAMAPWSHADAALMVVDSLLRRNLFEPPLPEGESVKPGPFVQKVLDWQHTFTQYRDDTPSALIYLALRAARRAVWLDPEDARSHLVLGECYLRLMHSTRERVWRVRVPELADLRRAQASYALNRAVALDPDLAQAHFHLGALYSDMGYLDLAAEHRRRYLELIRRGPLPAQVDLKEYLNSLERAERELTQLERRLRDLRDAWANEASGRRVGDRAELAARRGLAGEALRTLLASDVSAFGSQGLRLELRLLLGTGRAVDVIDAMEPDQQAVLGTLSYSWTRAEALAAVGNYDGALEECSRLAQPAGGSPLSGEGERAVIALFVTRAVAEGSPIGKTCPTACLSAQQQAELINRAVAVVNQTRQRADALALRGLLAVEAGRFDVAAESIDRAFTLGMAEGANRDSDWDFRAREIARSVADWLSARSR